jgi:hypothetical protein
MRKIAITALAIAFCGTAAWADEKPSDAEAKSIQATLKAWGCSGGEMEKEVEANSVYEVDDAKCADGNQYDIKLDKNFKVHSITAD